MTETRRKKVGGTVEVDQAHVLQHLIPDSIFADEYISREIKGVKDIDLLRYAKEARKNTLLFGPTGPGKTSLVLAYAATDKLPLVTIQANGAVDPNTFWGGWQPRPDLDEDAIDRFLGLYELVKAKMPKASLAEIMAVATAMMDRSQLQWVYSDNALVVINGGVLYINEANFMHPKIAAVFHGLDKRRQVNILEKGNEVLFASPELQLIIDYNPDYEGTRPLNAAFKNRFTLKVKFDYDAEVEGQLVYLPVMLEVATKLRNSHRAGDLETPVSTNMLIEFEELAVDLGLDFAIENFLNAFHEDERSAVRDVLELHKITITDQIAEMERLAQASA